MLVRQVAATVRSTLTLAREKEITFLAASVAFYAFFSVLPAMMLVLIIGSILGGEALAERIISFIGAYLSSSGEMVVNEALTEPPGYLRASTAGFLALMWSTLKVFRGISIAFDRIYQVDATTSLLQHIIEGVVVLLTTISALGLMVGLGMVIGRPDVVSVPYIDDGSLDLYSESNLAPPTRLDSVVVLFTMHHIGFLVRPDSIPVPIAHSTPAPGMAILSEVRFPESIAPLCHLFITSY